MKIPKVDFDGYIFDHDGTLSLSMHVHFDGWIESFKKMEVTSNLQERLLSPMPELACTIQ